MSLEGVKLKEFSVFHVQLQPVVKIITILKKLLMKVTRFDYFVENVFVILSYRNCNVGTNSFWSLRYKFWWCFIMAWGWRLWGKMLFRKALCLVDTLSLLIRPTLDILWTWKIYLLRKILTILMLTKMDFCCFQNGNKHREWLIFPYLSLFCWLH